MIYQLQFIIRIVPQAANEKISPYIYTYNIMNNMFDMEGENFIERPISYNLVENIVFDWLLLEGIKQSKHILGDENIKASYIFPSQEAKKSFMEDLFHILKNYQKEFDKNEYDGSSHALLFTLKVDVNEESCSILETEVHDIQDDDTYDTKLMKDYTGERQDLFANKQIEYFIID